MRGNVLGGKREQAAEGGRRSVKAGLISAGEMCLLSTERRFTGK